MDTSAADEQIARIYAKIAQEHAEARAIEVDAANGCDSDKNAYRTLVLKLGASGLVVRSCPRHMAEVNGMFISDRGSLPVVELYRIRVAVIDDLRDELFTLAHEAGHWRSWSIAWPDGYIAARDRIHERRKLQGLIDAGKKLNMPPVVTRHEGALYADEERRAWEFGRQMLLELKYKDINAFNARSKHDLEVVDELVALHTNEKLS